MVFFLIFQIVSLRLRRLPFLRVMVGILYTYAGLVLFLTGVNVGFSPVGYALGAALMMNQPISIPMGIRIQLKDRPAIWRLR